MATVAEASVDCGMMGGRLAAFVDRGELNDLKLVIPANDLWLGKTKGGLIFNIGDF